MIVLTEAIVFNMAFNMTRYDQLCSTSAFLVLCPLQLICPMSRHKGRACLGEVITHFMPIQTPMSLIERHSHAFFLRDQ